MFAGQPLGGIHHFNSTSGSAPPPFQPSLLQEDYFYQSLLATLTKATANMASALTFAAFEASAADASSATNPASPPDLAPSDHADHSDDAEF